METYSYLGAALVALLALLPALVFNNFKPFGDRQIRRGPWLWDLATSELGAVTVTYYVRGAGVLINGSTVNPTAIQASQVLKQAATVAMGDQDVQALFTHNWGLDASAPTYFEPEVLVEQALGMTFYGPSFTFDRTNTNVLKINKLVASGPVTLLVTIRRPHSIGQ